MTSNYKSAKDKIITVQEAVSKNLLQKDTSFVYMDESFNTPFYQITDLPILPNTPLHTSLIEELKLSLKLALDHISSEELNSYILLKCNFNFVTAPILPKNILFLKPTSTILIIQKA